MNYPAQGFPQQGFPQQQQFQQQPQQQYQQPQQQQFAAGQQLMPQGQSFAPQSNAPVPLQNIQLPSIFQNIELGSEMSDNVSGGFAVVSIKGKVFRIKFGGNETAMTVNFQGAQVAAPFFDVIIPRASDKLAKTYYEGGYTEGSDESPRCASEDGIAPNTPNPIAPQCALCPMNAFGSKINEMTGKRGKACADTRKIVVVPANNPDNETFGGPMLLRVPAASLGSLADYDKQLRGMGIPYYAVVTRISFDQTVAYPRLIFTPVAGIDEATAARVMAYRADIAVNDILFGAPTSTAPMLTHGGPVPPLSQQQPVQQQQHAPQPMQGQPQYQPAVPQQQYAPQPTQQFAQQPQFQQQFQPQEQAFPGTVPGYPGAFDQQQGQPQQQFQQQPQQFQQQQPQTVPGFDPMAQGGMQAGFQPAPMPQQQAPVQQEAAPAPAAPKRRGRAAAAAQQAPAPQPGPVQPVQAQQPMQGQVMPQQTGFAPAPQQAQQAPGGLLGKLDALLGGQQPG